MVTLKMMKQRYLAKDGSILKISLMKEAATISLLTGKKIYTRTVEVKPLHHKR